MISIEAKYAQLLESLRKQPGKEKQFRAVCPIGAKVAIEVLCNCAEAVLNGKVEEAQRNITKHNGASENFSEGSPLNESRSQVITETSKPHNIFAKADALMLETMTHPVTKLPLTEAEKRSITGGKPAEYATLNERQKKEYEGARMFNFSESDSLTLARMVR